MIRKDDWKKPRYSYLEDGKMVMTEEYHIKRGSCCGSKCKHCPFWPQYIKMNKELKEDVKV